MTSVLETLKVWNTRQKIASNFVNAETHMHSEVTKDLSAKIESILRTYNAKRLNLMVSGGSLLRVLKKCDFGSIDTSRWHIFFSDERCDSEYSNFRAAYDFIAKLGAHAAAHSIGIGDNKSSSAQAYKETLFCYKQGDSPIIDLCLLGIGPDGHICSIMPNSEVIESQDWVAFVKAEGLVSPERITVTPRFLNEEVSSLVFIVPYKHGKKQTTTEPHNSIQIKLSTPWYVLIEDISDSPESLL